MALTLSQPVPAREGLVRTAPASRWQLGLLLLLALLPALMAVLKYQALASNWFDLGLFETDFHNLLQPGGHGHAFYGHAQPLMPLYAWLYQASGAPGILALQGLSLTLPALWLWRHYGFLPALACLLYYPLWVNALFDFHFDHLAVPLLCGFYLAYERGRIGWAVVWALALCLVKEPFALQTAACGLFLYWRAWLGRREAGVGRLLAAGTLLVLAGFGWFYIATHWLIPYFTGSHGGLDAGAFAWLGNGLGAMLKTLATQPWLLLLEPLQTPGKLVYLAVIFGLLAGLPLLRPGWLIPALPPLAIAMLARSENYYSYGNHYTAGLIVPLMVAFAHGLAWLERRWRGRGRSLRALYLPLVLLLLAGHALFTSSPIGRLFWSDKVWSYRKEAYLSDARSERIKSALLRHVPADPTRTVAVQNPLNWGHLPRRHGYFAFPDAVLAPKPLPDWSQHDLAGLYRFVTDGTAAPSPLGEPRWADYVVLDMRRPWFVLDRGCDWRYDRCHDQTVAARYLDAVAQTRRRYAVVHEDDGFLILQRNAVTP
ncbi:DUF2079 domain-containing protein [Chitinimonas lacunae]|uniref:DUF2079 domain-containing protein n=1 Tax=Chitinimonas lacunae TaxID=1963018 RepID=A0ABV8MX76_9NEIS